MGIVIEKRCSQFAKHQQVFTNEPREASGVRRSLLPLFPYQGELPTRKAPASRRHSKRFATKPATNVSSVTFSRKDEWLAATFQEPPVLEMETVIEKRCSEFAKHQQGFWNDFTNESREAFGVRRSLLPLFSVAR
jgi:hypothetical protein